MIIVDCFDGDDMEMAEAQHDLYEGENLTPDLWVFGRTTLGYIVHACACRGSEIAYRTEWCRRNERSGETMSNEEEMKRAVWGL